MIEIGASPLLLPGDALDGLSVAHRRLVMRSFGRRLAKPVYRLVNNNERICRPFSF
jgi:hypothetical protein